MARYRARVLQNLSNKIPPTSLDEAVQAIIVLLYYLIVVLMGAGR